MTREQLIESIRKAAVDNRLGCAEAYSLAQDTGVPLGEIGALCNELKIRISRCQLGCF